MKRGNRPCRVPGQHWSMQYGCCVAVDRSHCQLVTDRFSEPRCYNRGSSRVSLRTPGRWALAGPPEAPQYPLWGPQHRPPFFSMRASPQSCSSSAEWRQHFLHLQSLGAKRGLERKPSKMKGLEIGVVTSSHQWSLSPGPHVGQAPRLPLWGKGW